MTARLLALGFVALFAANAFAVTTMGARSCGKWVKDRSTDSIPARANEAWLAGFLSGLAVGTDKDILADAESNSLFLWIDNYCKSNPLDNLAEAAGALFVELRRRKSP